MKSTLEIPEPRTGHCGDATRAPTQQPEWPVAESDLRQQLQEVFSTRAERVIFVEGNPNLDFHQVARVIDIARGVGVDHVELLTKEIQNAG